MPEWFRPLVESRASAWARGSGWVFATMLANAAGPVIQLYLMARKVPKMELIGIGARFFLLINLLKVPLNARLALITPTACWKTRACCREWCWGFSAADG
jgi:uncharacterized protein